MPTLPRDMFGACWTPEPIATLDVRRSPDSVCTIRFADDRGHVHSASGRTVRRLDGRRFDLFHTGVLARMLGCSLQNIYAWEEQHGFPRPCWHVARRKGPPFSSRLYSRRQLFAVQMLHRQFGCLRGRFRERVADFAAAVSSIFWLVDNLSAVDVPEFIRAALVLHHEESYERLRTRLAASMTGRPDLVPGGMGRGDLDG